MDHLISTLNSYVWSWPMVGLCLAAALYFSIGTRFVQVRHLGEMLRLVFGRDSAAARGPKSGKPQTKKEGISSFQAFALALSGRVGTGNVVGVALAIGFGGPGAIVWMWIIAFLGAGTAYAEATLAQIYKERHDGQFRGGPAYYIEHGLRCRWLAVLFAVVTVLVCAICLPPVHSNSIAVSFASTFHIAPWVTGLATALLLALVMLGGVKRIGAVAEVVAPFMAITYILVALVVLAVNIRVVPGVFRDMVASAFGFHEALGGIIGAAIAWGVKRGLYSNEAGQGTAPIVAAAARVSHPVKQGLVQGFSVYVDTLLVCTATAVVLLATQCYNVIDQATGECLFRSPVAQLGKPGVDYTIAALGTLFGRTAGSIIISITLFFFAFTTIMAYYYYAETNLVYLFSKARRSAKAEHRVVLVLRLVFVISAFVGSVKEAMTIWDLGDMGVGLMAWINLVAILLLSPKAFKALRSYERQQKAGKDPVFDPAEFGLDNPDS